MQLPTASARFDDLSRAGVGSGLIGSGFLRAVEADGVGDVADVLVEVERAARSGRWVAGFVSYDAAPGLDPGLVVPGHRSPGDVPLAWFGVFERAEPVDAISGASADGAPPWTVSLQP